MDSDVSQEVPRPAKGPMVDAVFTAEGMDNCTCRGSCILFPTMSATTLPTPQSWKTREQDEGLGPLLGGLFEAERGLDGVVEGVGSDQNRPCCGKDVGRRGKYSRDRRLLC